MVQMPALKVKSRANRDCVRGHSLHTRCRSTKSLKGLRSQVKSSQQTAEWHTRIQNCNHVASNTEVSRQETDNAEANDFQGTVAGDSTEFVKFPFLLSDPISIERLGSQSATCPSIMETIFSPILEQNDDRDKHSELPDLVTNDNDDGSSTDSQTGHLSDFYASESFTSVPFDEEMGFTDVLNHSGPDYEHIDPDLMFVAERYMIMPFHEETVATSGNQDGVSTEEAVMNSDDSCLYLAIHQMKSSDQESGLGCLSGDLDGVEWFDPQFFLRTLPDLSEAVSSMLPILLPKETRKREPITLVLDLDETLVHSTLEHCEDADFTFPVFFNMKQHIVYVKQRPYLQVFLERVAQMFEIVIFTASQSIYAEKLLDILDPEKKLISQRIYRESCIFSDGTYTKDLTVLGVDLAKVAIIDNSPQVFRLQVNNGIPIRSWFDDPSDHALISLLPFLETLVDADDVRPIIAKRFGNNPLFDFN